MIDIAVTIVAVVIVMMVLNLILLTMKMMIGVNGGDFVQEICVGCIIAKGSHSFVVDKDDLSSCQDQPQQCHWSQWDGTSRCSTVLRSLG